MTRSLRTALALVVGGLALAGCNAFESFYGESDDPMALLEDAQAARQQGDLDRARALLASAYEKEPNSAPIRSELAQTILLQQGLDLFTLRSIADYFDEVTGSAAAGAMAGATAAGARPEAPYCSSAGIDAGTPLDPTSIEEYVDIEGSQDALGETYELLTGGTNPVVPSEVVNADLCDLLDVETGETTVDASALIARLRADGLTDAQIDAAYANFALASLAQAYLALFVDSGVEDLAFYSRNGEVGFCSAVPVADAVEVFRAQTVHVARAVYALSIRAQASGSADAQELAAEAASILQQIDDFAPICTR